MCWMRFWRCLLVAINITPAGDLVLAECIDPPHTHVWLSPFSENPSFADTPLINSVGPTPIYIWARLVDEEAITALSLNLSATSAVQFTSASLDNPSLDNGNGIPAARFEYTPAATLGSTSLELQGFTIGERERGGLGLSAATQSLDALYDPAIDAWRIGRVTLEATATELFLQVGGNGIQGVDATGAVTPEFDVVFGGEGDVPLCATEDRGINSQVSDAEIVAGIFSSETRPAAGSFFQSTGAELRLGLEAINAHKPWQVSGEFRAGGSLLVVDQGFEVSQVRGTVDVVTLAMAGALTGEFDSAALDDLTLNRQPTHDENGLFWSIDYANNAVTITSYLAIMGDLDGNRSVGFSDFLQLSSNFGALGDWPKGDLNEDGRIGFADFLALSQGFGTTVSALGPSRQSVPEPRSVGPLLVLLPWLLRVLRGKSY